MEEWKEYKLGDLINISSGFAYKGEFIGNGENYLLGMGCVSFRDTFLVSGIRPYSGDAPDRYLAYSGDIVLATRQQSDNLPILGMPAIIPKKYDGHKMIIGANLYKVQNNSDFSNEYIYWLMKSPAYVHHIKSCQTGTTVRMITKANIEDFTFLAPKKETRDKIAQFFWNIENKIELNRRINENLEQQAQALFKSWFVDFEPFKDGKFVDSELGMIPEGWKVGTLDEVGEIVGGGTPSKSEPLFYCDNGISWITPKDLSINQSKYISKGKIDITEIGYKNSSAKKIPAGSVLFSSRAPIGYIAIASNEVTTNQGFKSVIPQKAGTCFIYLFLKYNTEYIESQATGSTFKEVSGSLMKSQKLIIPTQYILDEFEYKLGPIFSMQYNLESENHRLIQIIDTLLPKLMSDTFQIC